MLLAQQQTLTVADGTDTEERLPFFAFFADYDQHSQMIYPASMLTALQGTQILSLTFYSNDPSSFDDFTVKLGETSVSNFNSETFVTSATTTIGNTAPNFLRLRGETGKFLSKSDSD